MGNKLFSEDFPDGVCDFCGKVFKRPSKFKTETEGFHEKSCELEGIKNAIKNGEEFDVEHTLDRLRYISKVSSFGGRIDEKTGKVIENRYVLRMRECDKIIKELQNG